MAILQLFLCVACAIGTSTGTPIPKFQFVNQVKQPPQFVSAIFGGTAKLDCHTSDDKSTVTLWKNPSPKNPNHYVKVTLDGTKVVASKDGNFTINNVEVSDCLSYRCEAQNKAGVIIYKDLAVHINSFQPGLVIKPEVPQIILAGENVSFTCETVKGPIHWFKEVTKLVNGQEVTVSRKRVDKQGSTVVEKQLAGYKTSVLTISNAQTIDAGIYECVLSTYHYQMSKNARVYVYEAKVPTITTITPSKNVRQGKDIVLKCNVKGFPVPKITWFKDGAPLPVCIKNFNTKCGSNQHYIWREHNQDLKIKAAQYIKDNGVFICEARNNLGHDRATVDLSVLTTPVLDKKVKTTIVGQSIHCTVAYSNPPPTIKWEIQYLPYLCTINSIPLSNPMCQAKSNGWRSPSPPSLAGTYKPFASVKTMTSEFTPPTWMQRVYYKCIAHNRYGSDSIVFLFRRS